MVDTASQTVVSETFEEELILRRNCQHFSEKVGDLENLMKREEFLRLKLEKLRKYQSCNTTDPGSLSQTVNNDQHPRNKKKKSASKSKVMERKRSGVDEESLSVATSDETTSSKTKD